MVQEGANSFGGSQSHLISAAAQLRLPTRAISKCRATILEDLFNFIAEMIPSMPCGFKGPTATAMLLAADMKLARGGPNFIVVG